MDPFGLFVVLFVPMVGSFFAWTLGAYMFVLSGGWRPQWLWLLLGCGLLGILSIATFAYGWLLGVLFCGVGIYEFVPFLRWPRRFIDVARPWERIGFAFAGSLIIQIVLAALVVVVLVLTTEVSGAHV